MLRIYLKAVIWPCQFLPVACNIPLCALERGNRLAVLDMLIKKQVFLCFLPMALRPQTQGFGGFSGLYRSRNSDELLPGFRAVIALVLGPLFDISELYPSAMWAKNAVVWLQAKLIQTMRRLL